ALYGTTFTVATVNAIYQNLFNRDAEPAGLAYWYGVVSSGQLSPAGAALAILQGAKNADAIAIQNKLAAATAFTNALDTTPEILGYAGNPAAAAARTWLHTVDSTTDSLTAALAGVDAAVASVSGIGGVNGQTFTLTTGIDNIVGTP